MKKILCLAASLLALTFTPVFGQTTHAIDNATGQPIAQNKPELTRFNLDFPGGTPAQLVKAIQKATGKPLNVIIPDDDADFQLPALKLNDITFPQLSDTLKTGSLERHNFGSPFGYETGYWFMTTDNQPTDNSVWFFRVEKKPGQPPVQKSVRFYSLAPYLDHGFTVDDITTAIQTGWKMAGITSPPKLEYHKETKLLIAFGEPGELQTIQDVLSTLPQFKANYSAMWRANQNLQNQVDELKREVSATNSVPGAAPQNNSGK